jgi:tryptophanase
MFRTIFEPFKIKAVEKIYLSSREERIKYLEGAYYNIFRLKSSQVIIDLLTDSGTSAMSADQWAAMMVGDESYAGASSWYNFLNALRELTGVGYIFLTHQGRGQKK